MAPQLRGLSSLAEDRSLYPQVGASQLPETPAPGDPGPSSGLCSHQHSHTGTHIDTRLKRKIRPGVVMQICKSNDSGGWGEAVAEGSQPNLHECGHCEFEILHH